MFAEEKSIEKVLKMKERVGVLGGGAGEGTWEILLRLKDRKRKSQ